MDKAVRRRTGLLSDQQHSLPVWAPALKPSWTCRTRRWRSPARSTWWDSGDGTPHASSMIAQVEFVAWDQGGAAEHKGPGDLKLSMSYWELALCCHYAPIADETLHRIWPGLPAAEALLTGRAGVDGHGASLLPLPECDISMGVWNSGQRSQDV